MRKNNQKGITTVKSALFVIIFALIAFIGWYVVGNNNKSKTQLNQTASDSIKTTSTKTGKGTKFIFKDLGVQIMLPNNLKGMAYSKNTSSNETSYDVYTPAFKQEASKCGDDPTANPAGFASISKTNGNYQANSTGEKSSGLLKQFNGFYYSYGDPLYGAAGCPDEVYKKLVDMQTSLLTSLQSAFSGAELVQ
jgi:hypothetical protein